MKIDRIKISGVAPDVLGFAFAPLSVSWRVVDPEAEAVTETLIELSRDPSFLTVDYAKRGKLSAAGEPLDCALLPRTRYYLRLTVTTDDETTAVGTPVSFETGKRNEPYGGAWIAPAAGDDCHPVFLRRFRITKPVSRARAYLFAAGVYEVRLDGVKCGDEYLAPYFNDYRFALQVSTYALDLTPGAHTLAVAVGRGWYRGRFGLDGGREDTWGDRSALIGEVHIDYTDGSREVLLTDGAWVYAPDDTTLSGIYDGEDVDRTRFSEGRPEKPVECLPDGGNLMRGHLTDRFSPPLRVVETFPAREVISTPRGETVLDFGQNFAGFVRFRCRAPRGTKVTLDFGEVLQDGCFYNDNYRTARARFTFVAGGDEEWVEPRFTYCGFRYVRVTGQGNPDPADFLGCALSSEMDDTLDFKTGHRGINRLLENVRWGMRSNFVDMPTDCPQRDERLGWTGDAQVFAPTACYLADTRAFYEKFLAEVRRAQVTMGGAVPNYLPSFGFLAGTSSVWGDVATFLPHTLYRQYGDREALRRHYPMMRDWVDYITRTDRENGERHLFATGFHFGDWLALDGVTEQSMKGGTDDTYLASLYYMQSAKYVAEAAEVLGYAEDVAAYTALAEKIRAAILDEYFTPAGHLSVTTQAGYLTALRFGVWRDKDVLLRDLETRLCLDRYRIRCGFVGAPTMCKTLADAGLGRLAYRFLLREDAPSWLACVNLGATTIFERWNSLLPDGHISGTGMNSLNHYAYGSVAEFLVTGAAGLATLAPGFSRAKIAPLPDVRLGYVDCTYRSASGDWHVAWRITKEGRIDLTVGVPLGCEAELTLPGTDRHLTLTPGVYHEVYTPDGDILRLFDPDTPLDEAFRDGRVAKILAERVPAFAGVAAGEEAGSVTLSMLKSMHYIPHDPAALDAALAEIYALHIEEVPNT